MNFYEALREMKAGHICVCKEDGLKYLIQDGEFQKQKMSKQWDCVSLELKDIDSEWELFEELKKTLSDKIFKYPVNIKIEHEPIENEHTHSVRKYKLKAKVSNEDIDICTVEDIKEFIKQVKDKLLRKGYNKLAFDAINESTGDRFK